MERIEEQQLVPVRIQEKEQEEMKELPLEAIDIPMSQLLRDYKRREIPRRWGIE